MRSVLAVVAVFVGFGVACGDEGEELSGAAVYTREKTQYWQVFCTCAAGETEVQPATSPCVRSYLAGQSDCEEELLEEDWGTLGDSAECLTRAYEKGTACLQRACGAERCLNELQADTELCDPGAGEAFAAECANR